MYDRWTEGLHQGRCAKYGQGGRKMLKEACMPQKEVEKQKAEQNIFTEQYLFKHK